MNELALSQYLSRRFYCVSLTMFIIGVTGTLLFDAYTVYSTVIGMSFSQNHIYEPTLPIDFLREGGLFGLMLVLMWHFMCPHIISRIIRNDINPLYKKRFREQCHLGGIVTLLLGAMLYICIKLICDPIWLIIGGMGLLG